MSTNTENNTKKTPAKHETMGRGWARRAVVVLVADILVTFGSFFAALLFRFDLQYSAIPSEFLEYFLYLVPLWCLFTAPEMPIFKE